MKAIVKYGTGDREVEVRDIPRPTIGRGEVLVGVRAVGICGSDVHMWRAKHSWPSIEPVTLGHEASGVIVEVGAEVTGWSIGDRVVSETAASICGVCSLCRSGRYNLCPHREGYGALRDGAMAEYLAVEPRVLHRIPDGVSFEQAALTEPFAVAFNGLVERSRIVPGDTVVIQGVGAIGAIATMIARLHGAGTIITLGTEIDESRLRRSLELGADLAVNISDVDPGVTISAIGDGLGADLVVDATGVSSALKQALEIVRPFGSIVKIGWGPQPLGISLDPLVAKAVSLHGSFSHTWGTWERVLQLFSSGRLDPAAVIGGVHPVDDWEAGFQAMESGRAIKSVISFAN